MPYMKSSSVMVVFIGGADLTASGMGRSGIDSGQFTSGQNSTISVCVPNREPYYRTVPFPRKAWSIPFKFRSVGKHSN
jgi:hypothetical protein